MILKDPECPYVATRQLGVFKFINKNKSRSKDRVVSNNSIVRNYNIPIIVSSETETILPYIWSY